MRAGRRGLHLIEITLAAVWRMDSREIECELGGHLGGHCGCTGETWVVRTREPLWTWREVDDSRHALEVDFVHLDVMSWEERRVK